VVDVHRDPDGDTYAERIRYRRGDDLPLPVDLDAEPIAVSAVLADSETH
jgi:hypothetical protein